MKYKLLKPISLEALEEAGACESALQKIGLEVLRSNNVYTSEYTEIDYIIQQAKKINGGISFLINYGFIEKIKEKKYGIGAEFIDSSGETCMLARIGEHTVKMVMLEGTTYWGTSVLKFECEAHKAAWTLEEIKTTFPFVARPYREHLQLIYRNRLYPTTS